MATWLKDAPMKEEKRKDFTEELKTKLPLAINLASSGKLQDACDLLLSVEKLSRLANDITTLKESCLAIIRLCHDCKNWQMLNGQLTLLSKRRAQRSAAITAIVKEAISYVDGAPSETVKVDLIVTLRAISDGKIYVEKERAQLTQSLSQIKEKRGDIEGAADVLQEVHVETYGAMTKLEKCEFILEQMRLTLARKDYIRSFIISKKIKRSILEEQGFDQCKLKFYRLMIEYHTHENDTLELCSHWQAIFNTPCVQDDETQWRESLECAVIFVILSPHSNHQSDNLHRLALEKKLEGAPVFKSLITRFITKELISFSLPSAEDEALKKHKVFTQGQSAIGWEKDLHTRIVEHNIRVVAENYSRVRMAHLANMIGLSIDDTEKHISDLVSKGTIYSRMDRPQGIVSFSRPKPSDEQLSNWAGDITQLLRLVETTCHLINKENMIHKI